MDGFKNENNYTDTNQPQQRVIILPESAVGGRWEKPAVAEIQTPATQQQQEDTQPATEKQRLRGQAKPMFAKGISRGAMVGLVVFCILLSSGLGFVGGLAADKLGSQPVTQGNTDNAQAQAALIDSIKAAATGITALTPAQVAAIAADSVVEINTQTEVQTPSFGFFGWDMSPSLVPAAGSGVIISEDGYIITNNHVVENAREIQITLRDGQSYEAQLIATDAQTDVAVLKIETSGLTAAIIGNSSTMVVGEPAVVIGNPLGKLGGSVTVGYISALDRKINLDGQTMNLLQTDASINEGNSGGGLFNQYGQLVGIVVAKTGGISVEGLGFAIPINDVRGVIDDLISYGYARGRIALGVEMLTIDGERAMNYYRVDKPGVYINKVNANSNAERAGLQQGDMVLSINGTEINDGKQVVDIIQSLSVGDKLEITYERNGETHNAEITMQETVPEDIEPATNNS